MSAPDFPPLPAAEILTSLGYAVFRRRSDGALAIAETAPEWLRQLWPWLGPPPGGVPIEQHSPFLQNFLFDAEACWQLGGNHQARSGPWLETCDGGTSAYLEATALSAAGESLLLLQQLGSAFHERHGLLQIAREKVVDTQRLQLEFQKKEVLLHCLAEDLTAGLGNLTMAWQLIELEERPTQVQHLLNLAATATREQQKLIHRVLSHFTAEMAELYGPDEGDDRMGTDLGQVLQRALDLVAGEFAESGVRLLPPDPPIAGLRIRAPAGSLERVVASLLENARQHTPPGETVQMTGELRADGFEVQIEDPGQWRPTELQANLSSPTDPGSATLSSSALRLQFCRIVLENCQGEIECRPGAADGNCFWFRLPLAGPA